MMRQKYCRHGKNNNNKTEKKTCYKLSKNYVMNETKTGKKK